MLHKIRFAFAAMLIGLSSMTVSASAADNDLSEAEKAEGYVLLFNGKDLSSFIPDPKRGHHHWFVRDGVISLTPALRENIPAYTAWPLWTKESFTDFVLKFDFHMGENPENGHSAAVLRAIGGPGTYRQKAIEVALFGPARKLGHFSTGAIRSMIKPASKLAMKPAGEWNSMQITVQGGQIKVELNGQLVNEINLDDYTEPSKRLDGSTHLVALPLKDMPRTSPIGFRDDYGLPVWLKNIKLKPLK